MLILAAALIIGLLIDRFYGEPPTCLHPVVAMGKWLRLTSQWVMTSASDTGQFIRGMLAWLIGAVSCGLLAFLCQWLLTQTPFWVAALCIGALLKPLFAWAMLKNEVIAVEQALSQDLDAARAQLSRLVSRDTQELDTTQIRETAIETLAENLNDSVIAPLFWFCLAGLPGAAIYRFANTADAMWGYRGEWEWAGKWAAWADDVLSWIPARLTALLLLPYSVKSLCQIAKKTPSPNGGWSMGAMALRLNVRLTKPGVYVLHADGRTPDTHDIHRAAKFAGHAVLLAAAVSVMLMVGISILSKP